MSQLDNTFQKNTSKIRIWIVIALGIVVIPMIWYAFLIVYNISTIFHEEPYDESHPASIIKQIENDCNFTFPEKMESLRAGDTIAAGIDHPHVFVLRFVTDQNGFVKLKQRGDWEEVTEETANNKGVDARMLTKRVPLWYKTPLEKGKIYENYLFCECNKLHLHILCVELTSSKSVVVYTDGWEHLLH